MDGVVRKPLVSRWLTGLYDLVCLSMCVCVLLVRRALLLAGVSLAPTSEFRGCMSNSVELCPMPLGMPAVRYMAPTPRLFLASLAAFISSTVSPSSAKVWTPALAGVPSSHSWKWRLWLTAKRGKGGRERGVRCLFVGMHISVVETPQNLVQTVRSFPLWSLCVRLRLPPISCN